MNPFLRDEIAKLRASDDDAKHGQATILEVLCEHTDQLGEIKAQTTKTNGRVTALENRPAIVGCPGKCNELGITQAAILTRLEKVEQPIRIAHSVKVFSIKLAIFLATIVPLITWVSESKTTEKISHTFFASRDAAIETAVKSALTERDAKKEAASLSAKAEPKPVKKP